MPFVTRLVCVCLAIVTLASQALCTKATTAAPATTTTPLPGGSLATLLAKARGASGAPYRYHIVSRSKEQHDGATFDVTTESQGLKYRAKSCARGLCTGFYFDGERSYNTNINDTPLPLASGVDGLQLTLRAIASYAFTDPGFVANGGTLAERDPVLRDGRTFRRISVAPRLGALLDAIVDPQSGFVVGVISDERKYAFEFADQRRIGGGVTLPFTVSLNGFTFTKYDARSIVPSDLSAPPGIDPEFGDAPAATPMVRTTPGDLPVVACTVGGVATTCLLDTGDSGLSMSLALATKLHLTALAGSYATHGPGRYVAGLAAAPALALGGVTIPAARYVVLNDLERSGYDVILGADVFAHARITLDFPRRSVTIAPPDPGGGGGVPLSFVNFAPLLPVTIDGRRFDVQLDTGDATALVLSRDFVEHHPEIAKTGATATVKIGAVELRDEPLDTREKLATDGQIGSAALQRTAVTIDYARGTLSLVEHGKN